MDTKALTTMVSESLAEVAEPEKAGPMAAYMKTGMPFYGVQEASRVPILRKVVRSGAPLDRAEYNRNVSALWALPHREEKYIALGYARAFDQYVDHANVALHRRLIAEGAWWDFTDEIATKLVGRALEKERVQVTPTMRQWIGDDERWIRRTSIICQLGHKSGTDTDLLSAACVSNLADQDFFIRKAIGWSLREHSKTDPDWVRTFVAECGTELSSLSRREATKYL